MQQVNLKPFLRPGLDVLFVGLNPPEQSNDNRHYFSGKQSRFFTILGRSGLTVGEVDKSLADDIVFGSSERNYRGSAFGVTDLVDDLVATDSSQVIVERRHVEQLVSRVRQFRPRFACVIHSKVRDQLNRSGMLSGTLGDGFCGQLLRDCDSEWLFNYFSNGNNVPDERRLSLNRELRDKL